MTNRWAEAGHAAAYLERADGVPHRRDGEAALLELLPPSPGRVLDLGTGDGRLLALVLAARPGATGVAVDFSPSMLAAARARFAATAGVEVVAHDLARPLPARLGRFDAVVSSFAIHHLEDDRKRDLYAEVLERLVPGGRFANLEHVASPTAALHAEFMAALGEPEEDPSNRLLDVGTQLGWLRAMGYRDVDCFWKWRELALLSGCAPA